MRGYSRSWLCDRLEGPLRLALVSCPVTPDAAPLELQHSASHKLNRRPAPAKAQMIDLETGKTVERDETIMATVEKGNTFKVEPEEIDALKIERNSESHHRAHVSRGGRFPFQGQTPYLMEPDDKNALDIFATIPRALNARSRSASAAWCLSRREHSVMIQPARQGDHADDLATRSRKSADAEETSTTSGREGRQAEPPMAETLIESMEGESPSPFRGPYQRRSRPWRCPDEGQEDHRIAGRSSAPSTWSTYRGDEGQVRRKGQGSTKKPAAKPRRSAPAAHAGLTWRDRGSSPAMTIFASPRA